MMAALDNISLQVEMAVTLRLAVKRDIPRFEWYGEYRHFRNLFRRAWREQVAGRRLLLVADCNDFPIGHIFIQLHSANPRISDGKTRAYLYSFRVMEIFQGHGIGTALITEAERLLVERGFRQATIAVAKDNTRALRLYERLNYAVFGEDPGRWSYTDHKGKVIKVVEPCWILEKHLEVR